MGANGDVPDLLPSQGKSGISQGFLPIQVHAPIWPVSWIKVQVAIY